MSLTLTVKRRATKGRLTGRTLPLHREARVALAAWLEAYHQRAGGLEAAWPLFPSRVRGAAGERRAITRVMAHIALKDAFAAVGLTGPLGPHAMRKTFANRVYERLGRDLPKTQRALGHVNINNTVAYLSFREDDIHQAILA